MPVSPQDYVEEQLDEEAFFASQGFTQHKIRTKTPVKAEEKAPGTSLHTGMLGKPQAKSRHGV
jgi:hypothetical protein